MARWAKSLLSLVSLSFVVFTCASARSQRLRYYYNATLYVFSLGVCSVLGIVSPVFLTLIGQRYNTSYVVARSFYYLNRAIMGYKIKLEGAEHLNQRPAIIVGNHQSFLDILYLGRMMPQSSVIMAKRELKWMPLLGQFSM